MDCTGLTPHPTAIAQTENLQRHFVLGEQTVRALDGVDLTIRAGEFLALMGPSGSGKSTLLYLLGGLDRPTRGRIWVHGSNGSSPQELGAMADEALAAYRGRQIGFVFQSFHLISSMTARQNVEFPMLFARIPAAARHRRAIGLLGGVAGIVLGLLVNLIMNMVSRVVVAEQIANGASDMGQSAAAVTPLWLPLFAVAFAAGIGLLSGAYPANRAAGLSPIRALKYE
jgi:ABC-type proline/glycine betaine transport system ATPase subunit